MNSTFHCTRQVLLIWASLIFFLGSNGLLIGQETQRKEAYDTDTVFITGQYGVNSIREAVQPVRVIGARQIEQMAAVDLGDVLTNSLNIRLSQDNVLGQSLSLQGLSGEHVQIMIDGVPVVGRQNGNIDLNQLNLLGIERIEIIEGPLSVNFGTNALAGAINLITRKQTRSKAEVRAGFYGEQIGTANANLYAGVRLGKYQLMFSGGRNFFDGWDPREAFWPDFERRIADTTRFQSWKPREQYFGRVQVFRDLKKGRLGYKLEAFDEDIINRGRPRAPYFEQAFDAVYHTQRLDHALTWHQEFTQTWKLQFLAGYNDYRRNSRRSSLDLTTMTDIPQGITTDRFQRWMSRSSLQWMASERLRGEVGYDLHHEIGAGPRIEEGQQDLGDYAVFSTLEWQAHPRLTIRPGLRAAYNTAYQAPVLPSLNMKWTPGPLEIRAAYARGFRAPGLKELYFYFVDINHNIVGNPDLQAEFSHHGSLNLRYQKLTPKGHWWQTELNGFYNDLTNQITLAVINSPQFTYVNIERFRTTGLTANMSWRYQQFQARLGASYIGRYNRLSQDYDLASFSFSPEITGNLSYTFDGSETQLSLFYKYQGRLPGFLIDDEGEVAERYISAFQMLDLTLLQPLWDRRITLGIGAKNLLGITQVDAVLASGVHSGGGNSLPISTGQLLFMKLDVNFNRP